jgi:SSS family solute:Na+ symporter
MFIVVNIVFLSLGVLLYTYAAEAQISGIEKSDQLFTIIAMQHATPFIGAFFIIGLIAAAYSSADSALTALTTSFCIDFLGFERTKPTNLATRRIVHIAFAVILFFTILIFESLNNDAVVAELFRAAGFTYGPLLGLFSFGILTKHKIIDKAVIAITLFSIALTVVYYYQMPIWVQGFKPGFELILINGTTTFILLYITALLNQRKA